MDGPNLDGSGEESRGGAVEEQKEQKGTFYFIATNRLFPSRTKGDRGPRGSRNGDAVAL
jgi:hypothetical protein